MINEVGTGRANPKTRTRRAIIDAATELVGRAGCDDARSGEAGPGFGGHRLPVLS